MSEGRWCRPAAAAALALAGLLAGCGGGSAATPAPADPEDPPDSASNGDGNASAGGGDSGRGGEVSSECRAAYYEYVAAWSAWFDAELEDSEAQAAIIAEFGQELPRSAALEEMREVAEELRYDPGFELWIRALGATQSAIERCGEGAPRPR
jgi:hypothetical protein